MKRFFAVFTLAALAAFDAASAAPLTYTIDKSHSDVAFQIRHYVSQVHAATYPAIKFVSNRIEKQPDGSFRVAGNLTLHGVTRAITLPVKFAGEMSDGRGSFHGGFSTSITLNRKEFGITWNRVLDNGGAMLGDEVEVQIDLEAVRK